MSMISKMLTLIPVEIRALNENCSFARSRYRTPPRGLSKNAKIVQSNHGFIPNSNGASDHVLTGGPFCRYFSDTFEWKWSVHSLALAVSAISYLNIINVVPTFSSLLSRPT